CDEETGGGNRFVVFGTQRVVPQIDDTFENLADFIAFESGEVVVIGNNYEGDLQIQLFGSGQKKGKTQSFPSEDSISSDTHVVGLTPSELHLSVPRQESGRPARFENGTWTITSQKQPKGRKERIEDALEASTIDRDLDRHSIVSSHGDHVFFETVCFDSANKRCLYRETPVRNPADLTASCRPVKLTSNKSLKCKPFTNDFADPWD
ncbi:MAG: hypothetical protein GY847_12135, partial [Proteobacteria bacterium]|nr:hypothetical protein [Pseudomonadota bacterium]